MKLTKIAVILAVIAGIILYFVLPANQFFLYFGIPAILIVNGVRILNNEKNVALPNRYKTNFTFGEISETLQKVASKC
ncbi:hypothetical protein [Enterococcus faecium]|uniref:hypothetical protein n=1 Tax=Enterococcus faecium TaxID=1352 RepID=UPI001885F783|nr:hypothetical protein [Enterococcus faecium]